MTKPHLRRWHFDLAIFVGLALLAASCWYISPTPRWQSRIPTDPTINMSVGGLGFSADSRYFYTLKDSVIVGSHLPKPMIQRWDVLTGELLDEYPMQMPAEDVAYLKPVSGGSQYFSIGAHLLANQSLLFTSQRLNYDKHEQSYRLYDITTGECILSKSPLILKTHLWYLLQNPTDGHHWGCYSLTYEPDEPAQLVDLTAGKTIHTFPAEKNKSMQTAYCSIDQQHLIIVWGAKANERVSVEPILIIYRLGTWERIHQITLPMQPFGTFQLDQDTNEHFSIKHMMREKDVIQLVTTHYRYNMQSKTFTQDGQSSTETWNGNDVAWTQESLRIRRRILSDNRQPPEPFLTIDNFLQRFGKTIWRRSRTEQQFYIDDLESGKPLRQLSGLTEFGNAHVYVNPTGQYLVGVKSSSNEGKNWITDYSLILYEIPHHLWQPTLRWIMYLSWILIIPWPLRYFLRFRQTTNPQLLATGS